MNEITTLKALEMLNNQNYDDLKVLLTRELLRETSNSKCNFFDFAKKFIKNADNGRPFLKTIQHKHDKQFVCDGYQLYVFNNNLPELETLPVTPDEASIDFKQVVKDDFKTRSLTDDDKFILKNIKSYIKYAKSLPDYQDKKAKKEIYAVFDNRIFNAKFLENLNAICGGDFDKLEISLENDRISPLRIKTSEAFGIMLPIRVLNDEDFNKFVTTLNDFKNTLNN